MTLTTANRENHATRKFQMPVRSMTLTTRDASLLTSVSVSDACQINDFDHYFLIPYVLPKVSDACQINDFDHGARVGCKQCAVSDACQINDFDHVRRVSRRRCWVSDACQINDFDHCYVIIVMANVFQMPVRSMTLTTAEGRWRHSHLFQMPVRSMTLTTQKHMFPLPL